METPVAAPALPGAAGETAIVLVNWRGADDTISCVGSIAELDGPPPYVIVIENGSQDQSLTRLRAIPGIDALIESPDNLGFGGGCNLGIAQARAAGCKYVWLLNNDTHPMPGALTAMLDCIRSDARIGAVGSLIFRDEACTDLICWGGGKVNFLTGRPNQLQAPGELNFITGTSMLLRLEALATIGDFDEQFFLYWEDTDLSFRLRAAGWRLEVATASHIRHAVSASAKKLGPDLARYFNNSAFIFFSRHAKLPFIPILANFLYRSVGQAKAGNYREVLALARILLANITKDRQG